MPNGARRRAAMRPLPWSALTIKHRNGKRVPDGSIITQGCVSRRCMVGAEFARLSWDILCQQHLLPLKRLHVCWSSFWRVRRKPWPARTARCCLTSAAHDIRFQAKASVCCTCGRRSATQYGAWWMWRSRTALCVCRSCASENRNLTLLEICADRDWRTGTSKRAARARYQSLLERVLRREYPGIQAGTTQQQPGSGAFAQPGLHAGHAARGTIGICGAGSQCGGDAVVGGCRTHLWHSLDGLPAAASSRAGAGGRAEALSAAGPIGD